MSDTNHQLARLTAESTAPKTTYGEEQDACRQHYNAVYGPSGHKRQPKKVKRK